MSDKLLLTIKEAAALLGMKERALYRWTLLGEIESLRLRRRVYIPRHVIEELANSSRQQAA